MTPFDRDDMYRLAGAIDDVCDHVDEAADNLGSWGVERVPEQGARAGGRDPARGDAARRGGAPARGLQGLQRAAEELRELEDEGDRSCATRWPSSSRRAEDAKSIIRWKDIHERLEEAVDALENAADVLEAIVVKNR